MNDKELEEMLREMVQALVSTAYNVELIAHVMKERDAEKGPADDKH